MKKNNRLIFKILLPIVISVLLLSSIRAFLEIKSKKKLFIKNTLLLLKEKMNLLSKEIDNEAEKNLELASLFSREKFVIDAYKLAYKGNIDDEKSKYSQWAREYLRKKLKNFYNGYYSTLGKTFNLHFHLPKARSLLRLWRKKQAKVNGKWVDISDSIESFRNSVIDINTGKRKIIKGVEIGRGGFAIRGMTGIYDVNGKLLGSVEVLSSFNDIFDKFMINNNESLFVFMYRKYLNIATKLQDSKKYPIIDNKYVLISKKGDLRRDISSDLLDNVNSSVYKIANNYFYYFSPIKDYSGKVIGIKVLIRDLTDDFVLLKKDILRILFMSLIFVMLVILVLHLLLTEILINPLNKIQRVASKIAEGDLTEDININQNDEIGDLARDFERMKDNLRNIVSHIRNASGEVFRVGDSINNEVKQLSVDSEKQMSAFEETSSAIEELAATSQQVAEKTEMQVEYAENSKKMIENLNIAIQNVSVKSDEIKIGSQDAVEKAEKAEMSSKNVIEGMNKIKEISEEIRLKFQTKVGQIAILKRESF